MRLLLLRTSGQVLFPIKSPRPSPGASITYLRGSAATGWGEKGYDLLKKRYNWETIAAKTLEVYEKIIENT